MMSPSGSSSTQAPIFLRPVAKALILSDSFTLALLHRGWSWFPLQLQPRQPKLVFRQSEEHQLSCHFRASEARSLHKQICHRFRAKAAPVLDLYLLPPFSQNQQQRCLVGLIPTSFNSSWEPGTIRAQARRKAAEEKSPGTTTSLP